MFQQLTNFNSPDYGSSPRNLVSANGTLYYIAGRRIDEYNHYSESELWMLDPATGQPVLIEPPPENFKNPDELTLANGVLYFTASNPSVSVGRLWKIDPATGTSAIAVPEQPNSSSYGLRSINNTLYFSGSDSVYGTELWKIDPVTNAPVRLTDISPGTGSSYPNNPTALNSTVYFYASDGVTDSQIWKLDPSTGNAVRVAPNTPLTSLSYEDSQRVVINNTLYFIASTGSSPQLLKLDPTTDTITTLTNFSPSAPNTYNQPTQLINVNGILYFTVEDTVNGDALWRLNPATNLPILVTSLASENYSDYNLTNFNNTLYFTTSDSVYGEELWKIDSAGSPVRVSDINPGTGSSSPHTLKDINGTLYFNADDGVYGSELWKLNAAGAPIRLSDINPSNGSSFNYYAPTNELTNVNGTLYFSANDGISGTELWKLNPSAGSPSLVKNLNVKTVNPPNDLTSFNGSIYFAADDGVHGYELWKLDSATGVSIRVSDINPGRSSSKPYYFGSEEDYFGSYLPTDVNGTLYFVADDGTNDVELWKLDAVTGSPTRVTNFAPVEQGRAYIESLTNNDGTLYFVAITRDFTDGPVTISSELWKIDPATGNPVSLGIEQPDDLISVNGILYFTVSYDDGNKELWRVDPTTGNPVRLNLDFVTDKIYLTDIKDVDGTLQFKASSDDGGGYELWQIEAATGKPVFLRAVDLQSVGGSSNDEAIANDAVYFSNYTPQFGLELAKLDPATGSITQFDLNPGSNSSYPRNFINVSNTLYFMAEDGTHGTELWKINPVTGTPVSFDINPGRGDSLVYPYELADFNGTLYFLADDGTHGKEVWKVDAATGDPVRLSDISPNSFGFDPQNLTYQNGVLYVVADDGVDGAEIWSIDLGNEAPLNTAPGKQTITKNTPLVFSAANGNAISVSDPDTGTNPVRVTLTALNGTLTLGAIANLTFTTGDGTSDPTLSFTGTLPSVNAALNGLTFTPTAGYDGTTSIQVTTNDLGNSGAGGAQTDSDLIPIRVTGQVLNGTSGNNTLNGTVGGDRFTGNGGKDAFVTGGGGLVGSIDSITDFGGVGRGGNPSTVLLANADTIRFSGAGLTAKKMLLNQVGSNTEITFVGINNTKVILQNFTTENLDNHRKSTGAGADVTNILFNGETSPPATDAFDVWDANLNNTQVFRKNTVTFLNDLSNTVSGFDGSEDVINGQLGNDNLQGKSGKDILRGGVGNDSLLGGADDDIVVGNSGNDVINGGKGNDLLNGGIGLDSFVFNSNAAFNASDLGIDTIEDFYTRGYSSGDRFILDKTTFTKLTVSANPSFDIQSEEFAIVTSDSAAAGSSAFITYNSTNGKLFYNQNGGSSGFGTGAQFAKLSSNLELSNYSFEVHA